MTTEATSGRPEKLLTKRQVCQLVALSHATIRVRELRGQFPRRIRLGARASRWIASEIEHWISEQAASRQQPASPAPIATPV